MRQQVEDTSQLAFYWIYDKLPGKRGSLDAVTPEKGKRSSFKCAGIIHCTAMVCTVQIAPGKNTARQMEALCICGSTLRHRPCKVEWSVAFYRDGTIFENSGPHSHSKYTHFLPVSKKTLLLQEFISRQPVVLRGSQTTMNSVSRSDISQISEEEHTTEGSMNIGDSDKGAHYCPSLFLHGVLKAGSQMTRIVRGVERKVRDRWHAKYVCSSNDNSR
jgi:hypothetical protein